MIERYGNRIKLFHVKDMAAGPFPGRIEIVGEGIIDFPAIFEAAGGSTKYYVVEHDPRFGDPTFDPFEAAQKGFDYLDCVTSEPLPRRGGRRAVPPHVRSLRTSKEDHVRTVRALVALAGAIAICAIPSAAAAAEAPPPDSAFQKVVIDATPGEPIDLAVLPDGSVLHTERNGDVWLHDADTGLKTLAAKLDVYSHDEEGLQSIALDPNFEENGWIYLYYSPPLNTPVDDPATPTINEGDAPEFGTPAEFAAFKGYIQLARFQWTGDAIDLDSEQQILRVPVDRGICCHVGGDIVFDENGNLLLSTGDDTNPFQSDGYAPIDERAGRNPAFDAQRSAANTNDLRGKILRIHVNADGSYTSVAGNLFYGDNDPLTLDEIYVMGLRNPFRIEYNQETGELYIADYSPDANTANPLRGPAGQGKWSIVTEAANFGWPYCATAELPYVDYDFATGISGEPFDCANPVNESPNNTGLTELPPVRSPTSGTRTRSPPSSRSSRRAASGRWPARPTSSTPRSPRARTRRRGRSTTTACRCSTSGRVTTSRRSSPRAAT